MRTRVAVLVLLGGAGSLGGCASLGPSPDEMVADLPPEQAVDPAVALQVTEGTRDALRNLRAGDYDAAQRSAEAAIDLDPRAGRARAVLGRCLMVAAQQTTPADLGLWQRAEGELRRASELAPDDVEVALLHAEFLEADGHLSGAADRMDRALESHPGDIRLLQEASRLRYELGEERAALPYLVRLSELGQAGSGTLFRIAQCRLRIAMTMRRADPDPEAVKHAFERAAESFELYREAVPEDSEGYSGEAFARFQLLQLSENVEPDALSQLVELYSQAIEWNEASPEPEFNFAVVLDYAERPAEARAAYERALQKDPEHLPSLLNLAAGHAAVGETEAAAKYCERALELGPAPSERSALEGFLAKREESPVNQPKETPEAGGKREQPR